MTQFKLSTAVNPSGGKHKQNISLLMNLNLFLPLPAPRRRIDDELA